MDVRSAERWQADPGRVVNWPEVVASVAASFEIAIRGDDWVGVLHQDQKVKVAQLTALGQPFVTIVTDVFERDAIDAGVALALNNALPIGAIEVEDHRVLLRATVPMTGLDPVYLRRIILHVARQGAHMRKMGTVRDLGTGLFTHYAE